MRIQTVADEQIYPDYKFSKIFVFQISIKFLDDLAPIDCTNFVDIVAEKTALYKGESDLFAAVMLFLRVTISHVQSDPGITQS